MFSFAKTSKTCALFTYYHLSIAYSNLPIYISFPIQWPEGKAIDSLSPYTHARKHEIKANFKAPRNSALIGSERVTYFAAEWIKYVCIICRRVIEQILEKKPGRLQRVIKGYFNSKYIAVFIFWIIVTILLVIWAIGDYIFTKKNNWLTRMKI